MFAWLSNEVSACRGLAAGMARMAAPNAVIMLASPHQAFAETVSPAQCGFVAQTGDYATTSRDRS